MKALFLLLMLVPLHAQDLVSQVLEHNPFDPARGHKESTQEENFVELIPADLPTCDGTLIFGELRYVLLTFIIDGKKVCKCMQVNESSSSYTVKSIKYNEVTLEQGLKTHVIKLFFQESKKDHRGGSRKAVSKSRSKAKSKSKSSGKKSHSRSSSKKSKSKKRHDKNKKKAPPKIIKKSTKPAKIKRKQPIKF